MRRRPARVASIRRGPGHASGRRQHRRRRPKTAGCPVRAPRGTPAAWRRQFRPRPAVVLVHPPPAAPALQRVPEPAVMSGRLHRTGTPPTPAREWRANPRTSPARRVTRASAVSGPSRKGTAVENGSTMAPALITMPPSTASSSVRDRPESGRALSTMSTSTVPWLQDSWRSRVPGESAPRSWPRRPSRSTSASVTVTPPSVVVWVVSSTRGADQSGGRAVGEQGVVGDGFTAHKHPVRGLSWSCEASLGEKPFGQRGSPISVLPLVGLRLFDCHVTSSTIWQDP